MGTLTEVMAERAGPGAAVKNNQIFTSLTAVIIYYLTLYILLF